MPVGTKEQVYYGMASHTPGGLRRSNLKLNKQGKVVSKARSSAAKKMLPPGTMRRGGAVRFVRAPRLANVYPPK